MIHRITCKHCNQEVDIAMYLYNERIKTTKSIDSFNTECYTAKVDGKAVCPECGREIIEIFHYEITNRDIIRLAVGEEIVCRIT